MLINYGVNYALGMRRKSDTKIILSGTENCYTTESESLTENHILRKMITEMLKHR